MAHHVAVLLPTGMRVEPGVCAHHDARACERLHGALAAIGHRHEHAFSVRQHMVHAVFHCLSRLPCAHASLEGVWCDDDFHVAPPAGIPA